MSVKDSLLKPTPQPTEKVAMFGGEFPVRRLSAARVQAFIKDQTRAQEQNEYEEIVTLGAQLVLDSIVDDNGTPLSTEVTAEQLLELYSHGQISAALDAVMDVNYLSERSKAAAKKS